ncbi:MAG: RNB domain-containing ribonuclease [Deltaproteobacteria bacterium]|nr:RNB domain-containing ribonuclease [Deltaproteobacteria bacterium]
MALYPDGSGAVGAGLILDGPDKMGVFSILDSGGSKKRLTESRIEERLPHSVISRNDDLSHLHVLVEKSQELREFISTSDLYEMVQSEYTETDTCFLRDLVFDTGDNASTLAVFIALWDENIYFKRKKGTWEVRKPESVEQIILQKKQLTEKENAQKDVIGIFKLLIFDSNLDNNQEKNLIGELQSPKYFSIIQQLKQYAVFREDCSYQKSFGDFVQLLLESCSIGHGNPYNGINYLLRKGGIIGEFENTDLVRYGIREDFQWNECQKIQTIEFNECTDLTDLYTVTIDDEETRDIDDALSCKVSGENFLIYVHIADPGYFNLLFPDLEIEVIERGTSLYLPEKVINMYPGCISEDLASLLEGKNRRALTFKCVLNADSDVSDIEIFNSIINTDKKLSYDEVDSMIMKNTAPVLINDLLKVSEILSNKRTKNGAFAINLPELKIKSDADGIVAVKLINEESPSRKLVSELMILANMIAGRFCSDNSIPVVYRVQPPPSIVLNSVSGLVESYESLKFIKKGEYTVHPGRHHGLGVDNYLQVTSPIRRGVDLVAHRQIKAFLYKSHDIMDESTVSVLHGKIQAAVTQGSIVEKNSETAAVFRYLEQNDKMIYTGTVIELFSDGNKGMVHIHEIARKFMVFFKGEAKKGDKVRLKIKKVDFLRETVNFVHESDV